MESNIVQIHDDDNCYGALLIPGLMVQKHVAKITIFTYQHVFNSWLQLVLFQGIVVQFHKQMNSQWCERTTYNSDHTPYQ
jgi:hypothetical protein